MSLSHVIEMMYWIEERRNNETILRNIMKNSDEYTVDAIIEMLDKQCAALKSIELKIKNIRKEQMEAK